MKLSDFVVICRGTASRKKFKVSREQDYCQQFFNGLCLHYR